MKSANWKFEDFISCGQSGFPQEICGVRHPVANLAASPDKFMSNDQAVVRSENAGRHPVASPGAPRPTGRAAPC